MGQQSSYLERLGAHTEALMECASMVADVEAVDEL